MRFRTPENERARFTPHPPRAQGAPDTAGPTGRALPRVLYLGGFDSRGDWISHGPYDYRIAGQAIEEALRKQERIWMWDPGVGEWRRPQ